MKTFKQYYWWFTHPLWFLRRIAAEVYTRHRPGEPWISHHAVRYLEQTLTPTMQGLEWGSGRSTSWYAKRLSSLTSVEHSDRWFTVVKKALQETQANNVDYRHVPLDHAEKAPTYKAYETTPKYVAVVEDFADDSLDFVVVDGHYRQACVQAVLKKIRLGGYLLIDNSNWMPLSEWGVPKEWSVAHRSQGFFGETTVWKKN